MSLNRQLVIVIGTDEGVTSALPGVLGELGYTIPQAKWLADFHATVLKKCLVESGDARPSAFANLLAEQDEYRSDARSWLDEQFSQSNFVLLKDARQPWFTALWDSVAGELGITTTYVTLLRPPADIVGSKEYWNDTQTSATDATAGWVNTMLYCERATRNVPRSFCQFSDLLNDWVGVVSQLDEQAGLPPVRTSPARVYRSADALVETLMQPAQSSWAELGVSPVLSNLADKVYTLYSELARAEMPSKDLEAPFDAVRREYRELYEWAESVSRSTAIAARRAGVRQGQRKERRRLARNTKTGR